MNSNDGVTKESGTEYLYPPLDFIANDTQTNSNFPLKTVPINSAHETHGLNFEDVKISDTPLTTKHYAAPNRKGWKGLSSLEKSLSVSLGFVSALSVALMIAVIVVGVKLNNDSDCKLVTPPTQATAMSTQELCDSTTTVRPRPPRPSTTPRPGSIVDEIALASRPNPSRCISPTTDYNSTICLTSQCFRKAGRILEAIDFTADPCQNFYQFACGNWIKTNPIPDHKQSWNQFEKLEEKHLKETKYILERDLSERDSRSFHLAHQFYHSCMHSQDDDVGLAEMRLLLEEMASNLDNETDPLLMMTNIRRLVGDNYVITLDVDVDDKLTSKNSIYLRQPQSGLTMLFVMMNLDTNLVRDVGNVYAGRSSEVESFYQELIEKLWALIYPNEIGRDAIVAEILDFERNLTSIQSIDDLEEPENAYHLLSEIDEAQLSPAMVSLLQEFVSEIFLQTVNTTILQKEIVKNKTVIVQNLEYFRSLEDVLNATKTTTIENYLKARLLLSHASQAGGIFQDLFVQFKRKVLQKDFCIQRWYTCAHQTNEFFGWALSSYLAHPSAIQGIDKLNETVSYLKDATNEMLAGLNWVASNESKVHAQRKLELMKTFLGFPDSLLTENSNSFVDSYFESMTFSDANNYFENYLEALIWLENKKLEEIHERFDKSRWPKFSSPSKSNSRYSLNTNSLVFPAGAIDWVELLGSESFPAVHYGYLGVALAENMLQGFDELGKYRLENGVLEKWWDNETSKNYMNLLNCFLHQYNSQVDNNTSYATEQSIRETVLHNGALGIAYVAYRVHSIYEDLDEMLLPGLQDYTPEQLFFLSYAQSQCSISSSASGRFNVQSAIGNSAEFAEQWKCPLPDQSHVCKIF